MSIVMACWVVAMISGLSWARRWTAVCAIGTIAVFLWNQVPQMVSGAAAGGWTAAALQLGVFGATPWLLALQRSRQEQSLRALHAQEAEQMMGLSATARHLLSVQTEIQQLETQIAEISDVYHVTKETGRALRLPELFEASLGVAPRLLDVRGLRLIAFADDTPQVLRATRTTDGRIIPSGRNHLLDVERAIIKRAVASGQSASVTAAELSCALPDGLSRLAWAPLWREQKPIGVLVADELPETQLKTLSIVAHQLSLQLCRISLYEQVESLAVTDALTSVSVRRYFIERAEEEVLRSKRHGLSATLLMIDLDFFKQKNDTYGHLVGDVVLKDVAQLLARNLREIDLIGRYGGEEFILLLIETPIDQAIPIAQRLRQLVEVHPIRAYDELLSQTISVGMAGLPEDAQTLEQLIERADQALYAAKRSGRNQVARWSEQSSPV